MESSGWILRLVGAEEVTVVAVGALAIGNVNVAVDAAENGDKIVNLGALEVYKVCVGLPHFEQARSRPVLPDRDRQRSNGGQRLD